MTTAAVRFTYADYLNLPEESRYEILDGDLLVSPSPNASHQRIVKKLARIFGRLLEDAGLGEIFVAPFDVVLSDTDVVQPDILFISKERASIVKERAVFGAPDLAVEVLSPATAERDRTVKAKLYARAGSGSCGSSIAARRRSRFSRAVPRASSGRRLRRRAKRCNPQRSRPFESGSLTCSEGRKRLVRLTLRRPGEQERAGRARG